MMEKRRVMVVKSPEAAGLLNAATLGIWGMIQCWRHLQETAQELKEIEAEEKRQRDLASGKKKP